MSPLKRCVLIAMAFTLLGGSTVFAQSSSPGTGLQNVGNAGSDGSEMRRELQQLESGYTDADGTHAGIAGYISQIISPQGPIGAYVAAAIVVMSLFFLWNILSRIHDGRAGPPLYAFAKLIISSIIITTLATQGMNICNVFITSRNAFQSVCESTMTSLFSDQGVPLASVDTANTATDGTVLDGQAAQLMIAATKDPRTAGIPYTQTNVNLYEQLTHNAAIVPIVSSVDGQTYIGIIPGPTAGSTAGPTGAQNDTFGSTASQTPGYSIQTVTIPGATTTNATGQTTTASSTTEQVIVATGQAAGVDSPGANDVSLAPINGAMFNAMINGTASAPSMLATQIKGGQGSSGTTPTARSFNAIESSSQNSSPEAKDAAASSSSWWDWGLESWIEGYIEKGALAIGSLAIGLFFFLTSILIYGNMLIVVVTSPLLISGNPRLSGAFWAAIKGQVMTILLPGIATIINGFIWGAIVNPLAHLTFFQNLNFFTFNIPLIVVMLVYPIAVWIVTYKAAKAFFNGESFVGSALNTVVGAAMAGVTITAAVATGGAAGAAAGLASGGGLSGVLSGGAKGIAESFGGIAQGIGASGGPTGEIVGAGASTIGSLARAGRASAQRSLGGTGAGGDMAAADTTAQTEIAPPETNESTDEAAPPGRGDEPPAPVPVGGGGGGGGNQTIQRQVGGGTIDVETTAEPATINQPGGVPQVPAGGAPGLARTAGIIAGESSVARITQMVGQAQTEIDPGTSPAAAPAANPGARAALTPAMRGRNAPGTNQTIQNPGGVNRVTVASGQTRTQVTQSAGSGPAALSVNVPNAPAPIVRIAPTRGSNQTLRGASTVSNVTAQAGDILTRFTQSRGRVVAVPQPDDNVAYLDGIKPTKTRAKIPG